MPHLKNNWLDTLLNFGVSEESANNLNHRQVVNLTLSLLCLTDAVMVLIFALQHSSVIVFFYGVALATSLLGFYLHYTNRFSLVKVLAPLSIIVQIALPSMFFFGSQSGFHWLFVTVAAYAFTAFRNDEKLLRVLITGLSIVLFVICEFYTATGVFLTEGEQKWFTVLTFLWTLFAVGTVITVVISRLRKVNNYLTVLAERDELTDLANRRKVLSNALVIYTEAMYYRQPCVFAILDLDHFKRINDTFGHDAGDLVLTRIASVMRSAIGEQDEIGRYGGEEFVVIMRNTTLKEAEQRMNRLREMVEHTHITTEKGIVIPVTISIGLAAISERTKRYEDALALADAALYKAKKAGRNRVVSQPPAL